MIEAEVDLGNSYEVKTPDNSLTFWKLRRMGYDSVWAKAKPDGPMSTLPEWIVYNKDQVRLAFAS